MVPFHATRHLEANRAALPAAGRFAAGDPRAGGVECVWDGDTPAVFAYRGGGGRLTLHSQRDPWKEAERWLAAATRGTPPDLVVVIGLGLGYLLDVLEETAPGVRVLAIEPVPALIEPLLLRRDWTGWLRGGRLTLLAGPAYEGRTGAWRLLGERPPVLLVHPVVARVWPEAVTAARDVWARIAFDAEANAKARADNGSRYLLNTLRNLDRIDSEGDVSALANALDGVPAVIVGAAPSLDESLDDLAAVRDRVAVIAVDTALRPLLSAGIAPDLVVAVDPSDANARHLQGAPTLPATWLLAEPSVAPVALAPFDGRTFTFTLGHDPWPWLRAESVGRGTLRAWGSVATSAFDAALVAGANPIAFVGLDFAFTGDRPYCRGTVYEEDWARAVAAGQSLDEVWAAWMSRSRAIEVPDVTGAPARTARQLVAFRDWIVDQIRQAPDRRFINASRGILHGRGIECAPLTEALSASPHLSGTVTARLAACHRPARTPSLDAAARRLARHARAHPTAPGEPIEGWIAFSAGRARADDIAGALEAGRPRRGPAAGRVADRETWDWLPPAEEVGACVRLLAPWGSDPLAAADAGRLDAASRALAAFVSAPGVPATEARPPRARGAAPSGLPRLVKLLDVIALARQASPAGPGAFWLGAPQPVARDVPDTIEPPAIEAAAAYAVAREFALASLAMSSARDAAATRLAGLLRVATPGEGGGDARVSLDLTIRGARRRSSIPIALPRLGRALTGCLSERSPGDGGPGRAFVLDVPELGVRVRVDPAADDAASGVGELAGRDPRVRLLSHVIDVVTPAVLTECGLAPALIVTQAGEGVAWVTPIVGNRGYIVDGDGGVTARACWPRPVLGEVPWNDRGVTLAWHNAPEPYVMLREAEGAPVLVESLRSVPCGPMLVHDGRALWAGGGGGLWAWTPGQRAERLVDVPQAFGVGLDRDGVAVRLGSLAVNERGRALRTTPGRAWRWTSGAAAVTDVPVGPEGACWSSATADGWTAEAFPHADLIRLSAPSREVWLGCDFPVTLAWAGRSLLVASSTGGTLLLFRDVLSALDRAAGRRALEGAVR
jgi:hypothetical protein